MADKGTVIELKRPQVEAVCCDGVTRSHDYDLVTFSRGFRVH